MPRILRVVLLAGCCVVTQGWAPAVGLQHGGSLDPFSRSVPLQKAKVCPESTCSKSAFAAPPGISGFGQLRSPFLGQGPTHMRSNQALRPSKFVHRTLRMRQGSVDSPATIEKDDTPSTTTLIRLKTEKSPGGTTHISPPASSSSFVSPDWLSKAQMNFKRDDGVPVADAKVEDIQELLGGGMYQALYNWQTQYGSIYRLPSGPFSTFLVVGDPKCVQHILRAYGSKYEKGMIAEQSNFLFGDGFPILEGEAWRVRRNAVGPGLHRKWIAALIETAFKPCALEMIAKLKAESEGQQHVNLEALFSQLSLDIIGRALFNYDFGALRSDSPIIKREAQAAVKLIREVVDGLVAQCKQLALGEETEVTLGEEAQAALGVVKGRGHAHALEGQRTRPEAGSLLSVLLESREEVSSSQLRDDLVGLLVAGHETTSSVLTWTILLLLENEEELGKVVAELDALPRDDAGLPVLHNILQSAPYLVRCLCESMRLFPQPPVYTRRAVNPDRLPAQHPRPEIHVERGQDVLISIYNLHRNPEVWPEPDRFLPARFEHIGVPPDQIPNETNTQGRFLPFGAGPRKCIGDQFAIMEAAVALALLLSTTNLKASDKHEVKITSGATIHTQDGFFVSATPRS